MEVIVFQQTRTKPNRDKDVLCVNFTSGITGHNKFQPASGSCWLLRRLICCSQLKCAATVHIGDLQVPGRIDESNFAQGYASSRRRSESEATPGMLYKANEDDVREQPYSLEVNSSGRFPPRRPRTLSAYLKKCSCVS